MPDQDEQGDGTATTAAGGDQSQKESEDNVSPPPHILGTSNPESGKSVTTRDAPSAGLVVALSPSSPRKRTSGPNTPLTSGKSPMSGGGGGGGLGGFKFDVADIACKAYFEEKKDDKNWNTTIFDKETMEKKPSAPNDQQQSPSEKQDNPTTDPATYPMIKQHQVAMGEHMAGLLNHANVTYQLQDSFNKFNAS
eukprot:sb/3471000/